MKKAVKSIGVLLACCFVITSAAQKTIDTIATKVDGYDIPIRIKLPKKATGKSPVYFFVHGGGWNGGDSTHVPPARMHNDANYLADQLGVIYVGLAYRCKGNNATFADAIKDLEASVKWFFDNADTYNADLTRIGFGGASAGSTLAAIMAQKYIPEISKGDRRIIFFDGEYVGSVARIPKKGSVTANFHTGGSAKKVGLVRRDKKICSILKPFLKKNKLFFTGIDVIGDYLTEINVTSPTGIQEINKLNRVKLEEFFWDRVEKKLR